MKRDGGLYGEVLHAGEWVEWRGLLECLFNTDIGEQVDRVEAGRLAALHGGLLD